MAGSLPPRCRVAIPKSPFLRESRNLMNIACKLCIFTVLALLTLGSSSSLAEIPNEQVTELVCQNWLQTIVASEGTWSGSRNPTILSRQVLRYRGQDVGVVYSIHPRGHVLVPLLKELSPVKSYSTISGLDLSTTDTIGYTAMVREALGRRLEAYARYYGGLDRRMPDTGVALFGRQHQTQWDRYAVDTDQFARSLEQSNLKRAQAGPLMSTAWDQGAPFNNLCPGGDGGTVVVGCVATAFAQVMNYWQWPKAGVGSYTYWWDGDQSCGGSTAGRYLTAYFDDPYDWSDMPTQCGLGCTPEEGAAAAELSYEVGVAFDMNYGVCASGAWPGRAETMYPKHFWYDSSITQAYRFDYTYDGWFDLLKGQIDLGRPIPYTIYSHEIVCDGWKEVDGLKQIHMNYGWEDGHNKWYTVDELYCPWDGCEWFEDYAMINMFPDEQVAFEPNQRIGFEPLEVTFTGASSLANPSWSYQFGDGGSDDVSSPTHVYAQPGYYDVSATVVSPDTTRSRSWDDCIIVLADSLLGEQATGQAGGVAEVTIEVRNTIPLSSIRIPIVISGEMTDISLDSMSTTGCRTSEFSSVGYSHWLSSTQYTLYVSNPAPNPDTDLPPGTGPVLRLYYSIPGSAQNGDQAILSFDGYTGHEPELSGRIATFNARCQAATITAGTGGGDCCIGIRGNVDGDLEEKVNVADLTRLVSYLFAGQNELPCALEADIGADGAINVVDLTQLVGYLFNGETGVLQPCP
jgi:hypothetical protein